MNYGDWRRLFSELDDYDKVTADDVQRVANTYLVKEHRTLAYTYVPGVDAKNDSTGDSKDDSKKEGSK